MTNAGNTELSTSTVPALKEWAVVCNALLEGEQIVTIRKGGIREDGRHFSVPHDQFFLFPTYVHQAPELLKPAYRSGVARTLSEAESESLEITGWCNVVDIIKVADLEALDAIDSKHIWTIDYVTERLRWKKRDPLWVLVLRAYRTDQPAHIPMLENYGGCKSWVDLDATLNFDGVTALGDAAFEAKRQSIRGALDA